MCLQIPHCIKQTFGVKQTENQLEKQAKFFSQYIIRYYISSVKYIRNEGMLSAVHLTTTNPVYLNAGLSFTASVSPSSSVIATEPHFYFHRQYTIAAEPKGFSHIADADPRSTYPFC